MRHSNGGGVMWKFLQVTGIWYTKMSSFFLRHKYEILFVRLFLYVPVNRYGHVKKVSSPNHTLFLGKLDKAVNQYFVHILSLVQWTLNTGFTVTDNNPSWISGREECRNYRRNYFMINLHESMGLGRDQTHGSAVRHISAVRHVYRLRYAARQTK